MVLEKSDLPIGYSIFDTFEDCWQYNEDACFIASTEDSAEEFLRNGYTPRDKCGIETISFADIMRDFGYSRGEYAMEVEAYRRFQQIAESNGVRYEVEPYDGDDTLLVVNIEGVARHDDEW